MPETPGSSWTESTSTNQELRDSSFQASRLLDIIVVFGTFGTVSLRPKESSTSLKLIGLPEVSRCPHCHEPFDCGRRDIDCWCNKVIVPLSDLSRLAKEFKGCLCRKCL